MSHIDPHSYALASFILIKPRTPAFASVIYNAGRRYEPASEQTNHIPLNVALDLSPKTL